MHPSFYEVRYYYANFELTYNSNLPALCMCIDPIVVFYDTRGVLT